MKKENPCCISNRSAKKFHQEGKNYPPPTLNWWSFIPRMLLLCFPSFLSFFFIAYLISYGRAISVCSSIFLSLLESVRLSDAPSRTHTDTPMFLLVYFQLFYPTLLYLHALSPHKVTTLVFMSYPLGDGACAGIQSHTYSRPLDLLLNYQSP